MLKEGMDLKEGLRNYQFEIIEDIISDVEKFTAVKKISFLKLMSLYWSVNKC